jgi:hypothetical protein
MADDRDGRTPRDRLGVSVATGHLGDALIIGLFFVAGVGVLAATVLLRRKNQRRNDAAAR